MLLELESNMLSSEGQELVEYTNIRKRISYTGHEDAADNSIKR